MRTLTIAGALAISLVATTVHAGSKPSVAEVEATVRKFRDAADQHAAKQAAELVSAPFTYSGFTYVASDDKQNAACARDFGAQGTATRENFAPFLDCALEAMWRGAVDGDAKFMAANPKKLPDEIKQYKAEIIKLAKTHTVVISHFTPAGPADYWNIYAATKVGGVVHLDALLTVNYVDNGG